MSIKIYFDLDGTLFDLYNKENWLTNIQAEKSGVFCGDYRLFHNSFYETIKQLILFGVEFGVITWTPMGVSPEYEEICRQEKINWIKQFIPFVTEINICSYGIPKQNTIKKKAKTMYLIDDNMEVCNMWETTANRIAINVNYKNKFTVEKALLEILAIIRGD